MTTTSFRRAARNRVSEPWASVSGCSRWPSMAGASRAMHRLSVALALAVVSLSSAQEIAPPPQGPPPTAAPVAEGSPPAERLPEAASSPMADAVPMPSAWQGYITAGGGQIFVFADVSGTPAQPVVTVICPQAGAMGAQGADPLVQGGRLSFTLASRGIEGRFKGAITADGHSYSGQLALSRAGETVEAPFTLQRSPDPAQAATKSVWEGILDAGGQQLPMSFTIADLGGDTAGGTQVARFDLPIQGLSNYPVVMSKEDDGTLVLVVPLTAPVTIRVKPGGDRTLVGTFQQATLSLPLTLTRVDGAPTVTMQRPQTPKPPFPYRVKDATIKHRFGHTLAGTLTLPARTPESPAKFPAVVLATGSGGQDRDETLFGHKPFLLIADALTRAGVAVLRFDDRGIGGSTGSFAPSTTHDFATDVDEATEWLKRQPEIDPSRIGIIGHSEGGLIAPIVAKWQWDEEQAKHPIAFIVLLAGPGVSGAEVLSVQMRRLLAAAQATPEEIEAISAAQQAFLEAIVGGADAATVRARATALVEAQAAMTGRIAEPMPPEAVNAAVDAAMAQASSAWMRTFIELDPRPWVGALRIPILAMNGELDTQVDADQNLSALQQSAAISGAPITVRRYAGLNHLFQPATTGSPEEYATIETTFDPTALAELVAWVVATAKLEPPAAAPRVKPTPAENPTPIVKPTPAVAPTTEER